MRGIRHPDATGPDGVDQVHRRRSRHWTIVSSLEGVPVQDIAFDPNDHSHMVLVTSDMKVYTSSDWGDSWTPVTTSGLTPTSLGLGGSITYNPGGSEVWIDASAQPVGGGIFKSAATDLTSWQDVSPSPGYGSWFLTFTSASSVYISRFHSSNGGTSWDLFGPSPWYGYGSVRLRPDGSPDGLHHQRRGRGAEDHRRRCDLGAEGPGIDRLELHLDGGLADRSAARLRGVLRPAGDLSQPRRHQHTGPSCRSPGASQVRRVLVDPFDSQRVYAGADSGFYASTDGGDHWTGTEWNLPPFLSERLSWTWRQTPTRPAICWPVSVPLRRSAPAVQQHRLRSVLAGRRREPWPGVYNPHCIAFDPATPGTVYFASERGLQEHRLRRDLAADRRPVSNPAWPPPETSRSPPIRSTWWRSKASGQLYRSVDDGATWQKAEEHRCGAWTCSSTVTPRACTGLPTQGLFFSSDAGDSWQRAAGVIGQVQTTALGYADADGHTILYAATNGGSAATTGGTTAAARAAPLAPRRPSWWTPASIATSW